MRALRDVLPEVEHRLCARHIYANWAKRQRGAKLRELFCDCARSTFEDQFNDNLRLIENESKEAANALVEYPVKSWVRAYFSDRCLSPSVDNNMSESFNHWIAFIVVVVVVVVVVVDVVIVEVVVVVVVNDF